jgi:hypothetical protein
MGGKSRKSGGVSKILIQKLKSGNYKPSTKKDETREDDFKGIFDDESLGCD